MRRRNFTPRFARVGYAVSLRAGQAGLAGAACLAPTALFSCYSSFVFCAFAAARPLRAPLSPFASRRFGRPALRALRRLRVLGLLRPRVGAPCRVRSAAVARSLRRPALAFWPRCSPHAAFGCSGSTARCHRHRPLAGRPASICVLRWLRQLARHAPASPACLLGLPAFSKPHRGLPHAGLWPPAPL